MARIHWLHAAQDDVERLYNFIYPHSPDAAEKATRAILAAANRLLEFPEIGRIRQSAKEFREWYVQFGANGYIIRYRIMDKDIVILRVWNGAEDR